MQTIKSMDEFDQALKKARAEKKVLMLDYYADWCIACITMERYVFTAPSIQKALENFVLLRVDVTSNNDFDQAIMRRFGVIAPPTFIFFNQNGKELTDEQIVGEVNVSQFLSYITRITEKESDRGY